MDVPRGHCWCCEVPLEQTSHCPDCKMAVYCSTTCEHRDRARHVARECPLFGTRFCSKCDTKNKMRAVCLLLSITCPYFLIQKENLYHCLNFMDAVREKEQEFSNGLQLTS